MNLVSAPDSAREVMLDWTRGLMHGRPVQQSSKKLRDIARLFHDQDALKHMDLDRCVYRVSWWPPVARGEEGGLFWGVTVIEPGKVGDEYFMTHGHYHSNHSRAEYYATVSGCGSLLQMDADKRTRGETMSPGSLHYIRGDHAHRVVNTGSEPLIFWACWGSDAGYDYGTIASRGFGARLVERVGRPTLLGEE